MKDRILLGHNRGSQSQKYALRQERQWCTSYKARMTMKTAREIKKERKWQQLENVRTTTYSEAMAKAQAAVFPDEELKEENFNRVNTDGFEKAVALMKRWTEMLQRVMFEKHSFRIEINYNAEANKTDFAIYTSTKGGKDGSKQEHSDS